VVQERVAPSAATVNPEEQEPIEVPEIATDTPRRPAPVMEKLLVDAGWSMRLVARLLTTWLTDTNDAELV